MHAWYIMPLLEHDFETDVNTIYLVEIDFSVESL